MSTTEALVRLAAGLAATGHYTAKEKEPDWDGLGQVGHLTCKEAELLAREAYCLFEAIQKQEAFYRSVEQWVEEEDGE